MSDGSYTAPGANHSFSGADPTQTYQLAQLQKSINTQVAGRLQGPGLLT